MKRLRIEVERVVAPLHATSWRKDRMREELLAHLAHLYEDERAKHTAPDDAMAAALARFGDPAELTRGLQESVPAVERILWYTFPGMKWKTRRPDESAVAHILRTARRAAMYAAFSNLALIGVVVLIVSLANRRPHPEKPPLVNVAVFLAICGIVQIVATFALPLCCELVQRQAARLRAANPGERAQPAALVALGLLLATFIGGGGTAIVVASFGTLTRIPIVTRQQFWLGIAVAAALTLLLSVIQARQQARATRQFDDLYGGEPEAAD